MNPEKKLDFKKTLEEITKLAEQKLSAKPRKHEGPGRDKIRRLTAEESTSKLKKEWKRHQEGGGD